MTAVQAGPWKYTLEKILPQRPGKFILGLNYSGIHDTAIAGVESTGEILLACSLERFSRVKQDGRPPDLLLEGMPWERIEAVAVATEDAPRPAGNTVSVLHPQPLIAPRSDFLEHGRPFYDYVGRLPAPKEFVCHYLSHAASAFWPSGFDEALCLTYDGGMCNSPWFGGLYRASRSNGIEPLDRFAASHYAKITSLYSVVTALLGFSPNKHEGKITGLAAYGKPSARCKAILENLFTADYLRMESLVEWLHVYSTTASPVLVVNPARKEELLRTFDGISREEIAATLQEMTEEHVLTILKRAFEQGWRSGNICLSGGLFANVKVNQRVKEFGFSSIFVSPPMTDDGSALGAAFSVASRSAGFSPERTCSVFLGPLFSSNEIESTLQQHGLTYRRDDRPARSIAKKLAAGRVVGVFQGRMEFGPRALGDRSILSEATDPEINKTLNARLRRTEFMPFAPITRVEDVSECYLGLDGAEHTAEFMTITCMCTDQMRRQAPAVVHLDGTARPQIVRPEVHPLLHEILTEYKQRTGISALINTSFNVHEEPIVCSPADAIRGFLETGLDDLFLEGGYMVSLADNIAPAYEFLRKGLAQPTLKEVQLTSINDRLHRVAEDRLSSLQATHAEAEVQRTEAEVQRKAAEERLASATEKETEIAFLSAELKKRNVILAEAEVQQTEAEVQRKAAEERLASALEKETEIAFLSGELKKRDATLADLQNQLQRVSDEIRLRDERIAELAAAANVRLTVPEKVPDDAEQGRNVGAAVPGARDERGLEIKKDTEERIADVKRLAGERLSMLESLHAQTERERHEFRAALESRDERIAQLERLPKKIHTEAENSRNEWTAALRGRDERILAMQKETEDRVAEMKRLADERLMMLQGLHVHAERERQELRAALKSRDERIGELEQVLEERLRLVEALHSEAERTRHEVSIAITAREERIAELEHAVAKLRRAAEFPGKVSS